MKPGTLGIVHFFFAATEIGGVGEDGKETDRQLLYQCPETSELRQRLKKAAREQCNVNVIRFDAIYVQNRRLRATATMRTRSHR